MLYPTQDDYDIAGKEKYGKIKESGVGTVETRWEKKDGKVIEILLSFAPIVKGKPEDGVSFTALDITDRKE